MLSVINTQDFNPATNEHALGTGYTGTSGIESIIYDPADGEVYGVNYNYLGTFDIASGVFFSYPDPIGWVNGPDGWREVLDVDGLSFEPETGALWASVRNESAPDFLIKIDPATGEAVPGAFGGHDYLIVQPLPTGEDNIDDISFRAADGDLIAIINKRGLADVIAVIDPATGVPTSFGHIYCQIRGVIVEDMEGLEYGCDGILWGTTGNKNYNNPDLNDKLWEIRWNSAKNRYESCDPRTLSYGSDYEGVTCGDFPAPPPTPVPALIAGGDYNGDGTAEVAVFRRATGLWAVRNLGNVYFGAPGDVPVPGDYSGTGTDAPAVFRPALGLWKVRSLTGFHFGSVNDIPIPADYNGDGVIDSGVYRGPAKLWALRGITKVWFGAGQDIPVPGDYNGDGSADIALYRADKGLWFIRGITRFYLGHAGDIPIRFVDGAGLSRAGVFRPGTGLWAVRGLTRLYYGAGGDLPIPGDYLGGGGDIPAVYRAYLSKWLVREVGNIYYGRPGDQPVTR